MGFERFRQGAVVDESSAYDFDAASLPKGVGAHQHAPAGSRRDRALRSVHAGERIEHLEEENECRNGGALGEAFTVELDHERGQHDVPSFGVRDQPADGIGRMHDVGVGEQQIIGRLRQRRCGIDALLCRPELACPSHRQAAAGHHAQSLVGIRNPARHFGGAIAAVVVDQNDRPPAAIVLREQRSDAVADAVRLVARRHHGGDPRPCWELCCPPIVALGAAPKASAAPAWKT